MPGAPFAELHDSQPITEKICNRLAKFIKGMHDPKCWIALKVQGPLAFVFGVRAWQGMGTPATVVYVCRARQAHFDSKSGGYRASEHG
jgi:hypothetical protein